MSAHDVAIIGAGPAGCAAAIEAKAHGASVLVLDEAAAAGGQVERAPHSGIALDRAGPDTPGGRRLRADLSASGVETRFDCRVWTVERHGDLFAVHVVDAAGGRRIDARALIDASGARERVRPVPGWTTPGTIGLAGATALMKSQQVLPGRDVVVAGAGPLLWAVAAAIVDGGGRVRAVVDAAPTTAWLRHAPAIASRPDLALRGAGWRASLALRRVRHLPGSAVVSIRGTDVVTGVEVAALDAGGRPAAGARASSLLKCDAVCIGFGLMPSAQACALLGATFVWDEAAGGWRPSADAFGRTDVRGLYVCGDAAGVWGAAAASPSGRLAALAFARDRGLVDAPRAALAARAPLRAGGVARRFGRAMNRLAWPADGLLDAITPRTIVCACEGVDRAALDAAIVAGATTAPALKAATRCTMGPCGGHACEDTVLALLARGTGRDRADVPPAATRPPLRPVSIDEIAGDFDYADLPIREPAPS